MIEEFNVVLTLVFGFASSTIGGLIIRALYSKVFSALASGINTLEEKQVLTASSAEFMRESQVQFEQILINKTETLISNVQAQNNKIVEYRDIIDYHIERDERILQLISDVLEAFRKEGE